MTEHQPINQDELLTCKELAWILKRHVGYVYKARQLGFRMPGGRATVRQFIRWLSIHPPPFATRLVKSSEHSRSLE